MAENNPISVIIVGDGPVALLTALMLHKEGASVTLVEANFAAAPPPQNPELAYMWGDQVLPSLFQTAFNLWRTMPAVLGLPEMVTPTALLELSTSPGREDKLRQEALLEALGGESVNFTSTLPPYVNRQTVSGIKSWMQSFQLIPGMLATLQDAVTARGIPVHPHSVHALGLISSPLSVTLDNREKTMLFAEHIVMASSAACKRLLMGNQSFMLPLRPARGHHMVYNTPAPEGMPLLLHRLKRGHLFMVPQPNQTLHVYYDAILDPLQATTNRTPDTALATALTQHIISLVPSLSGHLPSYTVTTTHWLTPDFLPALGPWPSRPHFILAVGFNGRGAAYAPAVAQLIAAHIGGEDAVFAPELTPNRFSTGLWNKTTAPGSLLWNEPGSAQSAAAPLIAAEYMSTVHTIEKPAAQYASNVRVNEKIIQKSDKKMSEVRERNAKPKVQTASLKSK